MSLEFLSIAGHRFYYLLCSFSAPPPGSPRGRSARSSLLGWRRRPGDVFARLLQPLHPPFVACCRPVHARHVLFLLRLTLPRWPARCAARGGLTAECGGRLVVWRTGGQPARRGPKHGGGVPRSVAPARAERRPPPRVPMGGAGRPLQPEVRRPHRLAARAARSSTHPSVCLSTCPSLLLGTPRRCCARSFVITSYQSGSRSAHRPARAQGAS